MAAADREAGVNWDEVRQGEWLFVVDRSDPLYGKRGKVIQVDPHADTGYRGERGVVWLA